MRLRACVYLCTSDEFCAEESACREVRECVSSSQRASVEKSRRKREQSVSRVARIKNSVLFII